MESVAGSASDKKQTKVNLNVDHSVAHALWQKKLEGGLPAGVADATEALPIVNRLGNCAAGEEFQHFKRSSNTEVVPGRGRGIQERYLDAGHLGTGSGDS